MAKVSRFEREQVPIVREAEEILSLTPVREGQVQEMGTFYLAQIQQAISASAPPLPTPIFPSMPIMEKRTRRSSQLRLQQVAQPQLSLASQTPAQLRRRNCMVPN